MEDAFADLEELWAELKRRHQENGVALKEIDTVSGRQLRLSLNLGSFLVTYRMICLL